MILKMPREKVFGRAPAKLPGGGRRHGAVVDGIEIAAGGQHVEPAARGRARRAGRHEFSVEAIEQRADFTGTGGDEARADDGFDGGEDGAGSGPLGIRFARVIDQIGGEGFEVFDDIADGAWGRPLHRLRRSPSPALRERNPGCGVAEFGRQRVEAELQVVG